MSRNTFLLIILMMQGCAQYTDNASIHPEFQPIISAFMNEASSRGVELTVKEGDYIIQFGRMQGAKSASCKPNTYPKIITIDSMIWKFINPVQKEALVFHELAHCLLMRLHNNEYFSFGECKSWMREDESKCDMNLQNREWRKYYLDEIFTPSLKSVPYWYECDDQKSDVSNFRIAHSLKIQPYKFQILDSAFINGCNDWIIELCGMRPELGTPSIGLRLNEIIVEASFIKANRQASSERSKVRLMIMHSEPQKVALDTTSETCMMHLSIQKANHTVLVFFGADLQYRLPVKDTPLKIGAYCSFPESNYTIDFYTLDDS